MAASAARLGFHCYASARDVDIILAPPPCVPECEACQGEARRAAVAEGVRAIVFDLWLQAVKDGERTVERALREVREPIDRLPGFDRNIVFAQFARSALDAADAYQTAKKVARGTAKNKKRPRGLPSGALKAFRDLVRLHRDLGGLRLINPGQHPNVRTAFHGAAEDWNAWGLPKLSAFAAFRKYYGKN